MFSTQMRFFVGVAGLLALWSLVAYQADSPPPGHLADPFSAGWMLADTNGDDLVDFIAGKVVVPAHPAVLRIATLALILLNADPFKSNREHTARRRRGCTTSQYYSPRNSCAQSQF
jgi:hypothetical protein